MLSTIKFQKRQTIPEERCNLGVFKQKENSVHCVASACESTTTSFVEHWVPVRLSNIQIEQYCGSLFSNATELCSSVKHDLSEIFRDILCTIRKCCDHPYLVDPSLRTSLVQGLPVHKQLDAEIKLSNKLILLYKILLEIRNRGLRVLILYQLLEGSGLISTGDILDDIIHEKCGRDSFVRICGGITRSKRREVLKIFNDKRNDKFVCLMETRACVPSIELISTDSVIIFNSDLDPMNDLRALQKIKYDSEQVRVFRLYSSHTVEEEVLILAKQGMPPEGNLLNIKQSMYHRLLNWGAMYLFKRLEEFHSLSLDAHSVVSTEDSFVEDVLLELLSLLPKSGQSNVSRNHSFIKEAQQNGSSYSKNISLLGELESSPTDGFSSVMEMIRKEPPYVFWTNLLGGRNPRWKYFSNQSPRARKAIQCVGCSVEESDGLETTPESCRKEARITACQSPTNRIKKLQSRNKQLGVSGCHKYASVQRKVKYISLSLDRRAKLTHQNQAAELTSIELQSPLPAKKFSYMPLWESSVQPSVREVPLQAASIASPLVENRRESSISFEELLSQASLSCQPPEIFQITNFETLQSVYNAFQVEFERLKNQKAEFLKLHEDQKMQLKMAYEEEVAQARNKHDMLLQNAEMAFMEKSRALESRYKNLDNNKSLIKVMLTRSTLKDTTISPATTNGCLEPGSSTVKRSEQILESHPNSDHPSYSAVLEVNRESASADIASKSNPRSSIPCVTAQPTSKCNEVATPAVRPDQLFASLSESICSLPVQRCYHAAVEFSSPTLTQNNNLPIAISRNLHTEFAMKAPAPHLRHKLHSLPVTPSTAPKPPSIPDERAIFLPVIIQKPASNVQT